MSGISYNPEIVPLGGTGASTLNAHGVLLGEGTSPIATVSGSSTGQVLTWISTSADPTFQTPTTTKWSLVNSWTYSSDVASVPFVGLSAYTIIRVVLDSVSASVSGGRDIQVSTDNGATYLTAAGDYIQIAQTGIDTNASQLSMLSVISTGPRSPWATIDGFNLSGAPKTAYGTRSTPLWRIPTTTAFNALQVFNASGGNLVSGSIYILGM